MCIRSEVVSAIGKIKVVSKVDREGLTETICVEEPGLVREQALTSPGTLRQGRAGTGQNRRDTTWVREQSPGRECEKTDHAQPGFAGSCGPLERLAFILHEMRSPWMF